MNPSSLDSLCYTPFYPDRFTVSQHEQPKQHGKKLCLLVACNLSIEQIPCLGQQDSPEHSPAFLRTAWTETVLAEAVQTPVSMAL